MNHLVRGRVIDQRSGAGIGGLRVEAWDKDSSSDDYVGFDFTLGDGSFEIVFDEAMFQEICFDRWPDLFFRVYDDNTLLLSTEASVAWNVKTPVFEVTLAIPAR